MPCLRPPPPLSGPHLPVLSPAPPACRFFLCQWFHDAPQEQLPLYEARLDAPPPPVRRGSGPPPLGRPTFVQVARALGQKRPLQRGLDVIRNAFLGSLQESSPTIRAKGLRAVRTGRPEHGEQITGLPVRLLTVQPLSGLGCFSDPGAPARHVVRGTASHSRLARPQVAPWAQVRPRDQPPIPS